MMVDMVPHQGAAELMVGAAALFLDENLVGREVEVVGVEGSQMVVLMKEMGTVYWKVAEDNLGLEEDVLLEGRAEKEYK